MGGENEKEFYGSEPTGKEDVTVKKIGDVKSIVAGLLIVIALIIAIVFLASGGMTKLKLSHKWYCLDENKKGHTVEFQFSGKGVELNPGEILDTVPFEYKITKDKVLVITATVPLFGDFTFDYTWDKRGKDEEGYWYLEGEYLYWDGHEYGKK